MCVRVCVCVCVCMCTIIIKEEIMNLGWRRGDMGEPGREGRGGNDVDAVLF